MRSHKTTRLPDDPPPRLNLTPSFLPGQPLFPVSGKGFALVLLRNRPATDFQQLTESLFGAFAVGVLAPVRLVDNGNTALRIDATAEVVRKIFLLTGRKAGGVFYVEYQFDAGLRFIYVLAARSTGAGRPHFQFFENFVPVHNCIVVASGKP